VANIIQIAIRNFRKKCLGQEWQPKMESGAVLLWLIEELKRSPEQGNILELKEVWLRFCSLAAEQNVHIPPHLEVA